LAPQDGQTSPILDILAPSWLHLGAKFGHLVAILGIPLDPRNQESL
jgi:hypothetical protein